jgi:hypothetical protein
MFSPTPHAFLSKTAMEVAMKTSKSRKDEDSTSATESQTELERRAPSHSRGESFSDYGLNLNLDTEEVQRLAQEIKDETVADMLLTLFIHWICKDKRNYDQARRYIRELNLDQVSPSIEINHIRQLANA